MGGTFRKDDTTYYSAAPETTDNSHTLFTSPTVRAGLYEALQNLVPARLHHEFGEVFYSGRSAFQHPSPIYLLGFNPGGDPANAALWPLCAARASRPSHRADEVATARLLGGP